MRLDARRVINLCIIALSALVCLLAVRTGWSSLHEYEQPREVEQVDAAADDFTAAAGYRELERTYGSALLGEVHHEPDMVGALRLARRRGDLIWQRAMRRARASAARSTLGADLLARLSSAESSFQALSGARQRLELCIEGHPCTLAGCRVAAGGVGGDRGVGRGARCGLLRSRHAAAPAAGSTAR